MCTNVYRNSAHAPRKDLNCCICGSCSSPQRLGSLSSWPLDIFGPLSSTTNGNQHIGIMKNRFSKLTRANFTAKVRSMQVVTIFLKDSVMQHGIHSFVLNDSASLIVSKCFIAICHFLKLRRSPNQPTARRQMGS